MWPDYSGLLQSDEPQGFGAKLGSFLVYTRLHGVELGFQLAPMVCHPQMLEVGATSLCLLVILGLGLVGCREW